MAERVPLGGSLRVPLKAFLSTDHTSEAIGQTVFVQVSKNMGAFANPAIGTYGARETGNGWYYIDLGPSDFNNPGPMVVRGTVSNGDPTEITYRVDPFPIEANVMEWRGGTVLSPNVTGVPIGDISYTLGVLSPAQAGYMALDWSTLVNKTAVVALSNTTIANISGTVPSNPQLWKSGLIPTPPVTGVPIVDAQYGKGTFIPGKPGYFPPDWGQIANPTTVNDLSNTIVSAAGTILTNLSNIANSSSYGNSALLTAITNINNLSALANLFAPSGMVRPSSGSIAYPITFIVKSVTGSPVDVDGNTVTLTATNAAGADRSSNLSSVTHSGTGEYTFTYTVSSAHTDEGISITASGTVLTVSRKAYANIDVSDADSLTALAAIQTKTDQMTFAGGTIIATVNVDKSGYSLISAYDAAKTASQTGDIMKLSSGTGANQLYLVGGSVAVLTNGDKFNYSLATAYDAAKTAAQAGDTMKVSTGTGVGQVSLIGGSVAVLTNADKVNYSLASAYDLAKTAAQAGDSMKISVGSGVGQLLSAGGSVPTSNSLGSDKTGYSLTAAYDAAKTAAQPGDPMDLIAAALGSLRAAPDITDDATMRASLEGQFRGVFNRFFDGVTQDGSVEQVLNDNGDVVSSMAISKIAGVVSKGKSS